MHIFWKGSRKSSSGKLKKYLASSDCNFFLHPPLFFYYNKNFLKKKILYWECVATRNASKTVNDSSSSPTGKLASSFHPSGPENFKKSRPKKLMKLKKFNFTKEHFPYFQKDKIIWDVKQQALTALPSKGKKDDQYFFFHFHSRARTF